MGRKDGESSVLTLLSQCAEDDGGVAASGEEEADGALEAFGVFGEVVEVGQMAAGAVEEEAHDLLEGFLNGQALGILSDAGK